MDVNIVTTFIGILISGISGLAAASWRIGKYQQIVDSLKADVDRQKSQISKLERDLVRCETIIDERTVNSAQKYVKSESPASLTDEGSRLLKVSGAEKFILDNQAELIDKIREKEPKTAYDVQEIARAIVGSYQNKPQFIPLKNYAFQTGLELSNIILVAGVFLRDLALPQLGYTPEDVDNSDPALNQ